MTAEFFPSPSPAEMETAEGMKAYSLRCIADGVAEYATPEWKAEAAARLQRDGCVNWWEGTGEFRDNVIPEERFREDGTSHPRSHA